MSPLLQQISALHWPKEYSGIQKYQNKDNTSYRTLAIIASLLSLFLLFIFPFALLITLPLSGYLFYAFFKNKTGQAFALLCKVRSKECWELPKPPVQQEDGPIDLSNTLYFFEISDGRHYRLSENAPVWHEKTFSSNHLTVNKKVFELFREGEEVFFIFSAANDLIGYFYNNGLILLEKESGKRIITSVSQRTYPPNRLEYEKVG
ncbi:MAG TPA: hypothetical protein VNB90_07560 [Cytophagaceae bacterium]|jgi:hypothetical protein|nr:hypothetical protein [Cytophagaceae bacterium]